MFTRGQVIVCMNYIFNNYNFKKDQEKNNYLFKKRMPFHWLFFFNIFSIQDGYTAVIFMN